MDLSHTYFPKYAKCWLWFSTLPRNYRCLWPSVRMAERSKALRSGRSLPWRRGFESHFWHWKLSQLRTLPTTWSAEGKSVTPSMFVIIGWEDTDTLLLLEQMKWASHRPKLGGTCFPQLTVKNQSKFRHVSFQGSIVFLISLLMAAWLVRHS